MHLSQNLKCLREQRGMSQQELAEVLEISQAAVGNWENEHREPDLKTIIRLAQYFGVSLDDFILKDLRPPIPRYASNLAYLRKKNGMTQQEIANLLGYSGKQGYNTVEKGKAKMSVENLEKISDFFGVTMDQLVKTDLMKGAE